MNAKRQTIWLVSMLSLMVVLSAYYLFTQDVNKLDLTTTGTSGNEVKVSTKDTTDSKAAGQKVTAGTQSTDAKASTDAKTATDAKASTGKAGAATGQTDDQVLQKLAQSASGADFFVATQIKRNDNLSKQTENLFTIINDSKKSNDEVTKAYEELNKIENMQLKMNNVEELLSKDYKNAIVTQDNEKWKIIVQANTLEKSQAVSIVDLVMKEMEITQDQISVQYMK